MSEREGGWEASTICGGNGKGLVPLSHQKQNTRHSG